MIVSCYGFLDYREYFKAEISAQKAYGENTTFHKLAEIVQVQPPYVSKVMGGHAHFSRDQLFKVLAFFEATEQEESYVEIIYEYSTSGVETRRQKLLAKVKAMQAAHLDTKKHLEKTKDTSGAEFDEYYLDPLNQIIHVCLSIDRYRRSLELIAKDLQVPENRVRTSIKALVRMGLVKYHAKNGYELDFQPLHLPRESPLYSAWDSQLRQMASTRRHLISKDVAYGFSVVFSADEKTRMSIQEKILELIKSMQPMIRDAKEVDVYQVSFDLFPWTRSDI